MSLTPPDKDSLGDWNNNVYADQWVPNTRIDFCRVNWDSEYRDIVQFDDQTALDAYIDQNTLNHMRIERMTTVRPMEPIRVNIPYNVAVTANYIRVNNPSNPSRYRQEHTGHLYRDVTRNYYYFVLDTRYIAPNTTELVVQLDVWQTFGYEVTPGWSYAERGHVGIANESNFHDYGRSFLTIPEGLDQGNEYNVAYTFRTKIADTDNMGIIIWATVDLHESGGSVENPRLVTATGSTLGDLPNGATAYYFNSVDTFNAWLTEHQDQPWVTQGIIQVSAIPPLTRYGWGEDVGDDLSLPTGTTPPKYVDAGRNWRDVARQRLAPQYRHLSKFLTFPYMVLELTTNTGTPIVLKPEQWQEAHAPVIEIPHFALPGPRVAVAPHYYNRAAQANIPDAGLSDGGEFLDMATGIFDFPQFSVVNNSYMGFLASQKNSIQYQHDSADWSQSKALRSADTGYDQANMGIDAANQQTQNSVNTNNATVANQNQHGTGRAITQAGTSLGMGMMGGPLGLIGGVTSAVSTGANEALNQSERNAQNSITNSSLQRSNQIQGEYSAGIRDSNRSLAQFSARGDYANQVAGINARVQDAKMTQPTTSGQVGGEAFNLSVDHWGYDLKVKMVPYGAQRVIGDFWLRYGYAVNTVLNPHRLQVMSHFTYWKFQEFTIVTGRFAEHYKNAIRGIFEKGVTVWSRPEDIHMTLPQDNTPITDVYYS